MSCGEERWAGLGRGATGQVGGGGEERLLSQIKEREKKQGPEAMQRGRRHSGECAWGEGEETACVQLHREGT